jgi:hypothetical protein
MNGTLVGIGFGLLGGIMFVLHPPENSSQISALIASIAGTLFGFSFAGISIMTALSGNVISGMKKHGHYKKMLRDLFYAALCLLVSMVVALVAVWISFTAIEVATVAMFGFALGHVLAAGYKFYIIVDVISEPE